MSWEVVVTGLETLLEGVTGFSAAQVSQEDYTILNKGIAKGVVLHHAGATVNQQTFGGQCDIHRTIEVNIFEQYKNPADTENDLRDDVELVMQRVFQYWKLNGTAGVIGTFLRGISDSGTLPEELVNPPNRWRMRTVEVEIWEHSTTGFAE